MAIVKIVIQAEDQTEEAFGAAEGRAKKLDAALKKSAQEMKKLAVAAAAIGTLAVNEFAKFDRGIREIGTLLGEVTDEDIIRMGEEVQELAIQYGQAIEVMTKARYDIVSAGFTDAADSAELLEVSSKLAAGGVSEVSKTADVLTSVLNAYQVSASQASRVSDILFTTVRLGKTTIDELSSSVGQAASIAPLLGVSFEDLSAAIATLTAQGLKTDVAVTALGQSMVAFLKPTKDMQAALKDLGFETGAAAVQQLGFSEALKAVTEGANEAEIAARFENIRSIRAVFPLVGDAAAKFADNIAEMRDITGATDAAFEIMADSASAQINRMREQWRAAMINIGRALVPVVNALSSFSTLFASLDRNMQLAIIGLTGLAFVVKALIPVMQFAGVTAAGMWAAITGPIGLTIAAVTAVGAAIFGIVSHIQAATAEMDSFRESMEGITAEQLELELRNLQTELDNTVEKQEELIRKLAQGLILTGEINIKGREQVTELQGDIDTLREKLAIATATEVVIETEAARLSVDELQERLDRNIASIEQYEKSLEGPTLAFGSFGGAGNRNVEGITDRVKDLSLENEILKETLDELTGVNAYENLARDMEEATEEARELEEELQSLADLEKIAGGVEIVTSASILSGIDENTLLDRLQSTFDSLQKQEVNLRIKAALEIDTDGAVSEDTEEALDKVQTNIDAVQTRLNALSAAKFQEELAKGARSFEQLAIDGIVSFDLLEKLGIESFEAMADASTESIEETIESYQDLVAAGEEADQRLLDSRLRQIEADQQMRTEAASFLAQLTLSDEEREVNRLNAELERLQEHSDRRIELEEAVQERIRELRDQELSNQLANLDNMLGAFNNFVAQVGRLQTIGVNKREQKRLREAERNFIITREELIKRNTVEGQLTEEGQRQLEAFEQRHEEQITGIQDSAQQQRASIARRQKPLLVAQAIANTARAVTEALPNIPLSILVGALGAAEVATIIAQPFQRGGIVGDTDPGLRPGESVVEFQPIGTDTVPAILTRGEAVIPRSSVLNNRAIVDRLIRDSSPIQAEPFQDGGFVGERSEESITPASGGNTINVSINPRFDINAIDAQNMQDFVRGEDFRTIFRDAVNERVIRLEVERAIVEATNA